MNQKPEAFSIDYDFNEHRHRYAMWTAARAQSACKKNDKIFHAIETASLRAFAETSPVITVDEFDALQIQWCSSIRNSFGHQDCSYGRAAKIAFSDAGGKPILVSLALAPGITSLSPNRMKVESLSIDEGFGSLDPNTLNIATDALERLHNQGRKVGVISHVQEMTKRIPVQIAVSRQSSGRSEVGVMGIE